MKKETKEKQNTKTETKKLSKKTKTKTQNKTLKENLEIEIARTLSIFQRNLKGERVLERPLALAVAKLLSGLTSSFLKEFIVH
jgi:hypothetical protein